MLMTMFGKRLLTSFILSILGIAVFLYLSTPIHAQTNTDYFDTQLHTTVTVTDSGQSRVKHEFTITNKTPTTYISQYGLKISSAELKNVTVVSDGQSIEPEIVSIRNDQQSGPGQTSIGITFPEKIVGEGKVRKFTISYHHPDAAVISGRVLEVALPPQANPEDYSTYTVTLITPISFGKPIRTTPDNFTYTSTGNQIITSFGEGKAKGVFALFGQEQLFDLDLTYHLANSTNSPGITQIALPPDTSFQKIDYQNLEPKPKKIELDLDGNWIATYELAAGSDTTVKLLATVKLTLEPNDLIPVPDIDEKLLSAQEYWPVGDASLTESTPDFKTPKEINDFVVKTLNYNTDIALGLPERLGAIGAMNKPNQAVCQEFTDLFVTLARSNNIYARRVTGYAHSQNSELRPLSLVEDILHSWPEYYSIDEKRWVPIDPTWEDTTGGVDYFHQLDLNHIVFAINGHNSVTPHPAGSYKKETTTEKTVRVDFGIEFPEHNSEIAFQVKPKKLLNLINIPGLYNLEITNLSGQAEYNLPLELSSASSQIYSLQNTTELTSLLPFQTQIIPLRIENKNNLLPSHDTIQLKVAGNVKKIELTTGPSLSHYFSQKNLILAVAGGAIFASLIAGSLLVFRRKR